MNNKPTTPDRNCSPHHFFTYGHCDEPYSTPFVSNILAATSGNSSKMRYICPIP